MSILVTGGAGYIGSHMCVELLNAGFEVVVLDNLSNSNPESLGRVQQLTGKSLEFHQIDLLDQVALDELFQTTKIDAVIHFAALKSVGESIASPLVYYQNNLTGTLNLCAAMSKHGVKKLVFSSSATVYGNPAEVPINEDAPIGGTTNPYGYSKLVIENVLADLYISDPAWQIICLRYFNPAGAHPSGQIGEDPTGRPNNLIPYIAQVAVGKRSELQIFGNDYQTPDGTGVRDYIHVVDLVQGHLKALDRLDQTSQLETYNLGTGKGYSVLEVLAAFEEACGHSISYKLSERRPGDIATCYADASKAKRELGWSANLSLADMCADAWRWQQKNPEGFR